MVKNLALIGFLLMSSVLRAELLPVIQGPTNETHTQISVLLKMGEKVDAYIDHEGETFDASQTETTYLPLSSFRMKHFMFSNLPALERWQLVIANSKGEFERRTLKSLSKEGPVRFAVISCTKDNAQHLYPDIWQDLTDQETDMILYVGDTVYIDSLLTRWFFSVQAKHIVNRHIEARNIFKIFRQKDLVPIYAVWDDHDFGLNNADRSFKHRDYTISLFKAFFPDRDIPDYERGPGVSKAFHRTNESYILLDNRYFQDQDAEPPVYLGTEQIQWLEKVLEKSRKYVFIAGGSQFFGAYNSITESYEGDFDDELKVFLDLIRKSGKKVAFLSGDIHATELMKVESEILGYETFELTSSGLIRKGYGPNFWRWADNPRQIHKFHGEANYALVDSAIDAKGAWKIHVQAVSKARQVVYKHDFVIP